MNALELHGLKKSYPDFTLGPIDLTLPGGTVCGLIGENGAGKSTTLKLILGILEQDEGTVRVLGRESGKELTCTKEEIGVVLSGEGIPTCMTAPQTGKVMAGIYHHWDAAAYADYCERFALPEKKKFNEYSTGMKMKLLLAAAAIVSKRLTPYGAEALVRREKVPADNALTPVNIEELFVMMVKGEMNA